jgi:hypothetical protein
VVPPLIQDCAALQSMALAMGFDLTPKENWLEMLTHSL